MLYFRQILIMLVSLYTVRVVFEILGAVDYGIYNVVAGLVTVFGFLSGSMAAASQRFFAFALGRGDYERLKQIFSLSLLIYALIALIILLMAETIGLWFVNYKLILPPERMGAARWIYQLSIVSFVFTIMVSPFMAAIIAHEDMNIYAAVSIAEALLKLGIVFLLRIIPLDKLQLYGILLCAVTVINTGIYKTICKRKYQECRFKFYWNKELFKEIAGFTGWGLFQIIAGIFKWQMINILLNQFFNQIIISARSISLSVSSTVAGFSSNFNTALKPRIIKEYTKDNRGRTFYLVFHGITGTWFLMYVLILPLILETPIILSIWLKKVPESAVLFVRLALLDELLYSIGHPINAMVQASGKIKLYEFAVGTLCCLNFPLALTAFYLGAPPFSVFVIGIIMTLAAIIAKLLISRLIVPYSLMHFFRTVLVPIGGISILSSILPLAVWKILKPDLLRLCAVVLVSAVSTGLCVYAVLLDGDEREKIRRIVLNRIHGEHKCIT
jgi:O-antigen/teichoic acid export membrane protein